MQQMETLTRLIFWSPCEVSVSRVGICVAACVRVCIQWRL